MAGRRFSCWEELNDWLERWSTEVADLRIHGTTYQRPIERFAREQLTPLGSRPPYRYKRALNVRQIQALAARFGVDPGAFLSAE